MWCYVTCTYENRHIIGGCSFKMFIRNLSSGKGKNNQILQVKVLVSPVSNRKWYFLVYRVKFPAFSLGDSIQPALILKEILKWTLK